MEGCFTCVRLLFGTDTNDLTGGVRRGTGAVVISDTLASSSERDQQDGGAAHSPTAAAELPAPSRLLGPTPRPLTWSCRAAAAPAAPVADEEVEDEQQEEQQRDEWQEEQRDEQQVEQKSRAGERRRCREPVSQNPFCDISGPTD